jgi:hypothetical protein
MEGLIINPKWYLVVGLTSFLYGGKVRDVCGIYRK